MSSNSSSRRVRAYLSSFTTSQIHLQNPLVVMFFAFSFPGFGNLLQHRYATAFMLISWEIFINHQAKVNLGILYSLIGQFDKAKEVLDERWLIIYVGIYMYSIWDSYRTTVDLNKQYVLADRENAQIPTLVMSAWDINYMDKRVPGTALAWSLLVPGLGHLYIHKVISGFFMFAWTIAIMYFSNIPYAIKLTLTGAFVETKEVIDMQWLLYMPSIYCFVAYDAFISTVEYNKLYENNLINHLRDRYQHPHFEMPV